MKRIIISLLVEAALIMLTHARVTTQLIAKPYGKHVKEFKLRVKDGRIRHLSSDRGTFINNHQPEEAYYDDKYQGFEYLDPVVPSDIGSSSSDSIDMLKQDIPRMIDNLKVLNEEIIEYELDKHFDDPEELAPLPIPVYKMVKSSSPTREELLQMKRLNMDARTKNKYIRNNRVMSY